MRRKKSLFVFAILVIVAAPIIANDFGIGEGGNPDVFVCNPSEYFLSLRRSGFTYLYASDFGALPTILHRLIHQDTRSYNAIAYNTSDDLIYGIESGTNHVLQFHPGGAIVDKGAVGLTGSVLSGAYAPNIGYFVTNTNKQIWWIDLVNMTAVAKGTLHYANGSRQPGALDVAFSPLDQRLYGFNRDSGQFARFGPATGLVTPFGQVHGPPRLRGGAFFDGSGQFYVFGKYNFSGGGQNSLMSVALSGSQLGGVMKLAQTPTGYSAVDGTSCTPIKEAIFTDDFESGDTNAWSVITGP